MKHFLIIAIALLSLGIFPADAQKNSSSGASTSLPKTKHFNVTVASFDMQLIKGSNSWYVEGDKNVLDHDLYIGASRVSQLLWEYVMAQKPSANPGNYNPVENVSWEECQYFILRLNQMTGQYFHLLTWHEWFHTFMTQYVYDYNFQDEFNSGVGTWLQDESYEGPWKRRFNGNSELNSQEYYGEEGGDVDLHTRSPHLGLRLAMYTKPKIIIPNGLYMIYPEDDPNFQLETQHANVADGGNIELMVRFPMDHMLWRVINHGDGTISIHSAVNSNMVFDIPDGTCGDNCNVQLWSYIGHEWQKWFPEKTSSGAYIIHSNQDRNYHLNTDGVGNGANVCIHSNKRKWVFQPL